jgi:hypothetical protein
MCGFIGVKAYTGIDSNELEQNLTEGDSWWEQKLTEVDS